MTAKTKSRRTFPVSPKRKQRILRMCHAKFLQRRAERELKVRMTAKTRSGRTFPVSPKRKAVVVHMSHAQFLQRRRSPRNHLDSRAHDSQFKKFFREDKRWRQRRKMKQERLEREPEANGTEDWSPEDISSPCPSAHSETGDDKSVHLHPPLTNHEIRGGVVVLIRTSTAYTISFFFGCLKRFMDTHSSLVA